MSQQRKELVAAMQERIITKRNAAKSIDVSTPEKLQRYIKESRLFFARQFEKRYEQKMTDAEFIENLKARLEYELQNQQQIEEDSGTRIFLSEKEAEEEDKKWLKEISGEKP